MGKNKKSVFAGLGKGKSVTNNAPNENPIPPYEAPHTQKHKGLKVGAGVLGFLVAAGVVGGTISHVNNPERFADTSAVVEADAPMNYLETLDGIYIGDIENDQMKGEGSFAFNSGETLKGTFKNNAIQGEATLTIPDVGVYTGSFKDGMRSGNGTFKWENGDALSCTWVKDQPDGEGTLTFTNGDILKGTFSGTKVSKGTYTVSTDAATLVYDVKDSKVSNTVSITVSESTTISGTYSNGKMNGECEVKFSNGDTYSGTIKNNKREGNGIYHWSDSYSSYYEGEWVNDLMNGTGKYFYNDNVLSGTWKDGQATGTMQFYYSDYDDTFKASFTDGKCTKIS